MLNSISLKDTARGEDIFRAVKSCLRENNLDLEIISGILTDNTPAMTKSYKITDQ